jgi:hypothetical protein
MKAQARAKVGGQRGNPGYRTPSGFKVRQSLRAKIERNKYKQIYEKF